MSIKTTKLFLLTTFSFIIFNGCNNGNNKGKLSLSQKKIIQNCINKVIYGELTSMSDSFLINPYFESFTFNNYTVKNYDTEDVTYQNKRKVLKELSLTEENFKSLQRKINKKYQGIYYSDLEGFSKGDESYFVLTFSGISDELVFLEIITYCEKINKTQLLNKDINVPKKDVISLAIILNEGNIKNVTVDNAIAFEVPCEVTDRDQYCYLQNVFTKAVCLNDD